MLEIVKNTISQNNMLGANDKVLVALSGGCDSICLSLVLMELGYNIAVAHVNHSIRQTASRDENFVMEFASRYNIPYHITKINIPEIAKQTKTSEETAGRTARYEFFEKICDEYGYTKIAVAHNLNDVCETFLMNVLRGSGIKGLCSIPKVRGRVIRPLINVSRQMLEQYVHSKGEEYVEDETNMLTEYTRNKIRHNVMPRLYEINPSFMKNMLRTVEILTEYSEYITNNAQNVVEKKKGISVIDKSRFMLLEKSLKQEALMIAYENAAGTNKDFEKKHIDYIIETVKNKEHGNIIDLCFNVSCNLKYGKIYFEKRASFVDYEYILSVPGELIIPEANIKFLAKLITKSEIDYNKKNCEYFDYDKIRAPVKVRNRKTGDKMVPFGMSAYKKVKDILINHKITVDKRNTLPVFEADELFWIYGVKRSEKYKIDKSSTNILLIEGEKLQNDK